MIKKELGGCIVVYRNVFSDEKINEYLDLIKYSEAHETMYISPSISQLEKNGIHIEEGFTPDGELMYTSGWMKWYDIGAKAHILDPKTEPYLSDISDEKKFLIAIRKMYIDIFQDYLLDHKDCQTFAPYINDFDINGESWVNFPPNILKQNGLESKGDPSLGYHIDAMPGSIGTHACQKRTLAANLYLNDNYEDGRITFLYGNTINNVKDSDNLKIVAYKPKAGDIVLYPAGLPVAHAVERPIGADRYVLNSFMEWEYDGSMGEDLLNYIDLDVYAKMNKNASSVKPENIFTIDGKDFFDNV